MRHLLLLAASLCIASPVLAQSAESVSEAYEEGRASGVTPLTGSEYAMCYAYWARWADSVAQDWEPEFAAEIIEPLREPAARKAMAYWDKRAHKELKGEDDFEAKLRAKQAKWAENSYDELMLALHLGLFRTLGTCAIPK